MLFRQLSEVHNDHAGVSVVVIQGTKHGQHHIWTFIGTSSAWDVLVLPTGQVLEDYDIDQLEGHTREAWDWLLENT